MFLLFTVTRRVFVNKIGFDSLFCDITTFCPSSHIQRGATGVPALNSGRIQQLRLIACEEAGLLV
jgi:hypothetical protein